VGVYTPEANFTANVTEGCAPFTVNFTNTSQFLNPNGNQTRWDWDFNDGITFPNTAATRGHTRNHTFNDVGVYSISMRNVDPNGCMDTLTRFDYITVHGILGGFTTTTPNEGCLPLSVSFLDTSSAPLTGIASWSWNFGDPNTTDDTSSLPNPTYLYTEPGFYTVSLTVTDSFGCTRTFTYTDYVNVQQPLASFAVDFDFICNNQSVNITDLSVGNLLSYNWQFTNADIASYAADGNPPPVTFIAEGIQTISLEVTDNLGCTSDTLLEISVFDLDVAGFASPDFATCFEPPLLVNFTNLTANNVDSTFAFWDFGNGQTSTNFNPSALYNVAGIYPVTLTVTSLSGCTATAIIDTVTIGGPWGTINILSPENFGCPCTEVEFEVITLNASTPVLLPGDGSTVFFTPSGIIGDTIRDTLTYSYCQVGQFSPELFLQDGFCSGNVKTNDTVYIDRIILDFDFDAAGLCDSGQVCFTETSFSEILGPDDITFWEWDFGDGNTSTDQNPCNFFAAPGFYDVELTVGNTKGCRETVVKTLFIPESPTALFGQSDFTGCDDLMVMFSDSSFADSAANIVSWFWDFDNGNTSVAQNPTRNFSGAGIRNISLTVTDNFGCTAQAFSVVEVFDSPSVTTSNDTVICSGAGVEINATGGVSYLWSPDYFISDINIANPLVAPEVDTVYSVLVTDVNGCTASASVRVNVSSVNASFSTADICEGETAFFTDLSSGIGGNVVSWNWDFGDGNTSNVQNPSNVYTTSGVYDVQLVITDNFGCQDDTTVVINVGIPPLASFVNDTVCLGVPTVFNSAGSLAGTGNIISYSWTFGQAGATSSLPNPSYTYTSAGTFNVCLTVQTDINCVVNQNTFCQNVIVYQPPVVAYNVADGCLGSPVIFNNNTVQGSGGIVSSTWNFGPLAQDSLLQSGGVQNAENTYANIGTYITSLTVRDEFGCSASAQQTVRVFASPSASFTFNNVCLNQATLFESTSTPGVDGLHPIVNYQWNFDEGAGFVNGPSTISHTFSNEGTYNVTLVVRDQFGCSDTSVRTITVFPLPVAVIDASETNVCRGSSINLSALSSQIGALPAQYFWDFNYNTAIDDVTPEPVYTVFSNSTIALFVQDANGCRDTAFTNITSFNIPNARFAVSPQCEDTPFNLTSSSVQGSAPIVSYEWNINGSVTLNGQSVQYAHPEGNTAITVVLTVEDANGCIDTAVRVVSIEQRPVLNVFRDNFFICPGESVTIDLNNPDLFEMSGVTGVLWSPPLGVSNTTAFEVTLSPSSTTTYSISAFGSGNVCPSDVGNQITVNVVSPPAIAPSASPNPVVLGGSSEINVVISPYNSQTDTLYWNDLTGTLSDEIGRNVTATPLELTTYPATLVYYNDTLRCEVETSVTIDVVDACTGEVVYAPNIFTPNNDGKNDIFRLSGYGLTIVSKFIIFDRWGKVMYENYDITMSAGRMTAGWDGTNKKGQACNSGVFVYLYEAICVNGDVIKGSGNVTLIK
jgi:gliding motility-associated-like protein